MAVQDKFNALLRNISLSQTQINRIESARAALASFLISEYSLEPGQVFIQGSYANGTAIKPQSGGEYDIDVICVCVNQKGMTSSEALSNLQDVLGSSGNYAPRIKLKNPCVRLEFAEDAVGKFHIDVVPVRPSTDAPLDAPHRKRGWHGTAPLEYTAWCEAQGELYVRTVKMLKHWRNIQQPVRTAIKSIVLQVLIQQCMPPINDDAARIAATFDNLARYLGELEEPPNVWNPVLPSEDLAASWPIEAFRNFKTEIIEAQELSALARDQANEPQAAELWSMLFGEEFPTVAPADYGLKLSDFSHAQNESAKGWGQNLDPRYSVTLSARTYRGYWSRLSKVYRHDGPPIFAGRKIKFKAHPHGPEDYEVWWQVANTGGHARSEGGLRGEFFRGKGPGNAALSSDQTINWESTSYTGVHLIRPLLVVNNRVVAKAPWMRVNVVNVSRRFLP